MVCIRLSTSGTGEIRDLPISPQLEEIFRVEGVPD
jgi:hypothetical protein